MLNAAKTLTLSGTFQLTKTLGQTLAECANVRTLEIRKSQKTHSEVNSLRAQKLARVSADAGIGGFAFAPLNFAIGQERAEFCDDFLNEAARSASIETLCCEGFCFTQLPKCSPSIRDITLPIYVIPDVEQAAAQLRDVLNDSKAVCLRISNIGEFTREAEIAMIKSEVVRSDVFVPVQIVE